MRHHTDIPGRVVSLDEPEDEIREATPEERAETDRDAARLAARRLLFPGLPDPRDQTEYRTGGELSDGTSFSDLATPEHYAGNHGRSRVVMSSEWDDDGAQSEWSTHDSDKHIAFDLLVIANDGEGFHVETVATGESRGPWRERDERALEEQLRDLLADVGYGSILEALSTTGNGKATDERIMRAFAALAEHGSYDEIRRLFGPTKNTLTKWRRLVDGLPPVEPGPE